MNDRTVIEKIDATVLEQYSRKVVKGWLTVWNGNHKGQDFQLYEGRNFVGADKNCNIVITDKNFPLFAFNIRISKDSWKIIDLDSDEGVQVNKENVFRAVLKDESWILVNRIYFRVKIK